MTQEEHLAEAFELTNSVFERMLEGSNVAKEPYRTAKKAGLKSAGG